MALLTAQVEVGFWFDRLISFRESRLRRILAYSLVLNSFLTGTGSVKKLPIDKKFARALVKMR